MPKSPPRKSHASKVSRKTTITKPVDFEKCALLAQEILNIPCTRTGENKYKEYLEMMAAELLDGDPKEYAAYKALFATLNALSLNIADDDSGKDIAKPYKKAIKNLPIIFALEDSYNALVEQMTAPLDLNDPELGKIIKERDAKASPENLAKLAILLCAPSYGDTSNRILSSYEKRIELFQLLAAEMHVEINFGKTKNSR